MNNTINRKFSKFRVSMFLPTITTRKTIYVDDACIQENKLGNAALIRSIVNKIESVLNDNSI